MTTWPNGRIPAAELRGVPAANSQTAWLLPSAAESFHRVRAACQTLHGWAPLVTSAGDGFRSYARQEAVFRERYAPRYATVLQNGRRIVDRRRWEGQDWYRHTGPAAAVPGTSNHGKGATVDVASLRYSTPAWADLAPLLRAEGWSNAEGATVSEPWHWNHLRTVSTVANTNTIPAVSIRPIPAAAPGALTPLEDDVIRTVLHPNGTIATSGPAAVDFTIHESMDELRGLVARGLLLPEDLVPASQGGRMIELPDPFIWDLAVATRNRARDQQYR